MFRYFLALISLFVAMHHSHAQTEPDGADENNETVVKRDTTNLLSGGGGDIEVIKTGRTYDPDRAALLSAVMPGLGQIYNKKYWKLPIVYIGAGVFFKVYEMNNKHYLESRTLYVESLKSNNAVATNDFYLRSLNYWKRNKDLTLIFSGIFYGVVILDAYVDAHLKGFEMSESLTLKVKPSFQLTPSGSFGTSLSLSLNFR